MGLISIILLQWLVERGQSLSGQCFKYFKKLIGSLTRIRVDTTENYSENLIKPPSWWILGLESAGPLVECTAVLKRGAIQYCRSFSFFLRLLDTIYNFHIGENTNICLKSPKSLLNVPGQNPRDNLIWRHRKSPPLKNLSLQNSCPKFIVDYS